MWLRTKKDAIFEGFFHILTRFKLEKGQYSYKIWEFLNFFVKFLEENKNILMIDRFWKSEEQIPIRIQNYSQVL